MDVSDNRSWHIRFTLKSKRPKVCQQTVLQSQLDNLTHFPLHNVSVIIFTKYFPGIDLLLTSTYQAVAVFIALCATVAEISCYATYCLHIYRQDNGEIKRYLESEVTRQRNKKNLTTFIAQLYGFATECAFLVVFLIILASDGTNTTTKAMAVVIKYIEFGGLCLVEIMSSETLRKIMLGDFQKVKAIFVWWQISSM